MKPDPALSRRQAPPSGPHPAVAGSMLIASMLACGAAGFGTGALIGAAVPLGLIGIFVGIGGGVALVYRRFRRI